MFKKLFGFFKKLFLLSFIFIVIMVLGGLAGYFSLTFFIRGSEVNVPGVVGQESETAVTTLIKAGLQVEEIDEQYNEMFPEGVIVSQEPEPGVRVKTGRKVTLVKSKGSEKVEVPNLVGKTVRNSELQLGNMQLTVGPQAYIAIPGKQSDTVIAQSPPEGSLINKGDEVALLLAEGEPDRSYIMPSVLGESLWSASQKFSWEGITVESPESLSPKEEPVVSQHPVSGARLYSKDKVILQIENNGNYVKVINENISPLRFVMIYGFIPHSQGEIEIWLYDERGSHKIYSGKEMTIEILREVQGPGLLTVTQNGRFLCSGFIPVDKEEFSLDFFSTEGYIY